MIRHVAGVCSERMEGIKNDFQEFDGSTLMGHDAFYQHGKTGEEVGGGAEERGPSWGDGI